MFKSKNTKKKRLKNPIKRILSGVASVLMLATMIPATVAVNASESDSPLVDMTMDGRASLTVTKYEMKDVSTATHIGTGEQESRVSEGGNIPNDAKAFSDVTFKISRIATVNEYFGTDGKALPTVTEAKTMLGSADEIKSVTTDSNGVAKFSNLKLGIYYVEETAHPAQVTKETAPFVVSVPFTATTGDKWLYDVYAYPKNQTNYANVTINKKDALSNKGIKNVEFALYRSTDNKATWSAVNNSANTNSYSTDESGKFTWENLPVNTYYKVKEVSVPDNKYILNNKTDYIFYLNADGDIEYSGETSGKNEILIYNDYVNPNKYVLNTDGNTEANYTNTSDAINEDSSLRGNDSPSNIGDTVSWLLEANVPAEIADMSVYKLVDKMGTGLAYKSSAVYGVDKLGNVTSLTKGTDYTVTESSTNHSVTFSLTSTGIHKVAVNKFKKIDIYFNTTVTADAELGKSIHNNIEAVYSNNLNDNTKTVTHTPDNPADVDGPETHTSGYQLKKVDNNGNALAGVTFKLYATEADAKNRTNELSFYTYDSNGNKVKTTTATSDSNGLVSFLGLSYGSFGNDTLTGSTTYYVVETSTLSGYNLLKEPFAVTVSQNTYDYDNTQKEVVNTARTPLPKTGVIATTSIGGIGLILLGVGIAVKAKKKSRETN